MGYRRPSRRGKKYSELGLPSRMTRRSGLCLGLGHWVRELEPYPVSKEELGFRLEVWSRTEKQN